MNQVQGNDTCSMTHCGWACVVLTCVAHFNWEILECTLHEGSQWSQVMHKCVMRIANTVSELLSAFLCMDWNAGQF